MSTTTNNLKQRFIRLLRKFKLPETEAFESEEQYKGYMEQVMAQNDTQIDDFLDEDDIGDFSDSGQEFDDISISSTPKPSLKPYFSTWTLEGPRDSSSFSNTLNESTPTTSNIHQSSNINPTNSPLSSSSTTTTATSTNTTTPTTNYLNTSINNTSSTSSPITTTTTNTTPIVGKSSKLRRILRKKDSTIKNKK